MQTHEPKTKQKNMLTIIISALLTLTLLKYFLKSQHRSIYLLDFACFNPPSNYSMPHSKFLEYCRRVLDKDSAEFQARITERSGIGEEAGYPHFNGSLPMQPTLVGSHEEAELVIFDAIDEVLKKTGIEMKEIGVVVVNCNCFAPVPSLAAKIVNRYEFREDVRSFNLSGMGCACGPVAVGLAGDLLRVHADEVALVVSTEITTAVGWYNFFLSRTALFRVSGG